MSTYVSEINTEKYITVTYYIESDNLNQAAWDIAVGQSIGNPYIRNTWENENLFLSHGCVILDSENELKAKDKGTITIGFPIVNINLEEDGIAHLICQLMGGHTDIKFIKKCTLLDIVFPKTLLSYFKGPRYGISGFRNLSQRFNKPLAGSIIKPKIGFNKQEYSQQVSQLIDAGIDFIKEDEIICNPTYFPLRERVEIVSKILKQTNANTIFCHTVNGDPHRLLDNVRMVSDIGGNGVHVNVFSGLGAYNSIRQLDIPVFLHMQTSGSKLFSGQDNNYHMSWEVICKLVSIIGVDTIQVGMIGGYSNDNPETILKCLDILRQNNTLPALSCGLHPGMIDYLNETIGYDYLANSGGSIHGHPSGTLAGAKALRQAIDHEPGIEYSEAIQIWGKK